MVLVGMIEFYVLMNKIWYEMELVERQNPDIWGSNEWSNREVTSFGELWPFREGIQSLVLRD